MVFLSNSHQQASQPFQQRYLNRIDRQASRDYCDYDGFKAFHQDASDAEGRHGYGESYDTNQLYYHRYPQQQQHQGGDLFGDALPPLSYSSAISPQSYEADLARIKSSKAIDEYAKEAISVVLREQMLTADLLFELSDVALCTLFPKLGLLAAVKKMLSLWRQEKLGLNVIRESTLLDDALKDFVCATLEREMITLDGLISLPNNVLERLFPKLGILNGVKKIIGAWKDDIFEKNRAIVLAAARDGDVSRIESVIRRQNIHGHHSYLIANARTNDEHGDTVLHVACRHDQIAAVELLVELGASVDATNRQNDTPLHVVSSDRITRRLIDYGANVDARGRYGWTPTIAASARGDVEVVAILLQCRLAADRCQAELHAKELLIKQWIDQSFNDEKRIKTNGYPDRGVILPPSPTSTGDNYKMSKSSSNDGPKDVSNKMSSSTTATTTTTSSSHQATPANNHNSGERSNKRPRRRHYGNRCFYPSSNRH